MLRAFCVVALVAFACLVPRAVRVGFAGDYIDSFGRITAQDEALYGHSAIAMAREGDWLTPHFMGRLALYKPPLLIWASALSARILGIGRLALRLPTILLVSFAIGMLFLWGAEIGGVPAGVATALLLLGNHFVNMLGTVCMTDGLLMAFSAAALYALFADPWLESRLAFWGFAAATAGAILSKGIAGLFPILALGLYLAAAPKKERPTLWRAVSAAVLGIALAAPWFVYQFAAHPRWFWTEHVLVEVLGYGTGSPPQTSHENRVLFYLLRFTATDPALLSASVVAIPAFWRALRARLAGPTLLACWALLGSALPLIWQYRNASYLLSVIPPVCLIAACYGPFSDRRQSRWMLAVLAAVLFGKAALPDAPWGLDYRDASRNPTASAISRYCESASSDGLIVVDLADGLYGTVLPIRLHYATTGPLPVEDRYSMPFRDLGIILSGDEFTNPASHGPLRSRLHDWGVDSAEAIGTLICTTSNAGLDRLVHSTPNYDYLIPERYRQEIHDPDHIYLPAAPGYGFLIARRPSSRAAVPRPWTCRM